MNIKSFFKSKQTLFTILAAVLVGVGVYVFANRNNQPASSPSNASSATIVKIDPSGITYPAPWQESKQIALENKQAGIISEANRTNPGVKVVVREVNAELAKNFDIKALPDEVESSLKGGLDGFSLKDKSVIKIDSYDAVKIGYTSANTGQVKYTNTMFIIPTPKKTFYITYSSTEDLSKISSDITKINQSIAQYIKTHALN